MTAPEDAKLQPSVDPRSSGVVTYELTLYVSGASGLAGRAIANATKLCDAYLKDHYHLSVIDIQDNPAVLIASQVLATPTLIKTLPLPVRRVVGDLSRTDRVLSVLQFPVSGLAK